MLFDEGGRLGGHLRIATSAPNRRGWQSLLDFYERAIDRAENVEVHLGTTVDQDLLAGFDHVVAAVGSREVLPDLPGVDHALSSSSFIAQRSPSPVADALVILDDGFGWWPCASAVETGIAAGWQSITVLTPAASFGGRLPPEGHVQLMARLRGAPLDIRSVTGVESITRGWVTARNLLSGQTTELAADLVVVVGERRARAWEPIVPAGPGVHIIGDAAVPRRVHHAIAEGRATARILSGAVRGLGDQREDLAVGDRR